MMVGKFTDPAGWISICSAGVTGTAGLSFLRGTDPVIATAMGIKNALPAERWILDFLHSELQRVLPNATWTAAGIGRHQMEVMCWVSTFGRQASRATAKVLTKVSTVQAAM